VTRAGGVSVHGPIGTNGVEPVHAFVLTRDQDNYQYVRRLPQADPLPIPNGLEFATIVEILSVPAPSPPAVNPEPTRDKTKVGF
jgi:hypothetical protein